MMLTYLLRIAGGKQDVPNALKRFRVGFLGKAKNDRITVDYMILPVGITVSRRKVLCDLRKLVNHRSALSFDLSEFHRQGILAALAVVGHIDGKNVFLPSGQFGRIVHAAAINLHGVNAAQSTDQPFLAELTVIQFHKVHHAPQDRCPERIRLALPCSHDQPQGLAVDFLAHRPEV